VARRSPALDKKTCTGNKVRTCSLHLVISHMRPRRLNQRKLLVVGYCRSVSDVAYRQRLRSASSHEVSVPRHRLSTYGRRAFAVAGPTVWNSLPEDMRDPDVYEDSNGKCPTSIGTVLTQLRGHIEMKTYLFSQYFAIARSRVRLPPVAAVYQRLLSVPSLYQLHRGKRRRLLNEPKRSTRRR